MIDKFTFATEIDVRISDINYGGHLGNDRYLSLFQDARLRYLQQFGYSEISIGDNTSLIMSQAHIDFKAEAFWGDRLKIYVRVAVIQTIKFKFEYLLVSHDDAKKVIATGYTEMVGFDYPARKIKKLPAQFVQDVQKYEQHVEVI